MLRHAHLQGRWGWLGVCGFLLLATHARAETGWTQRDIAWQPGTEREFLFLLKGERIGQLITQVSKGKKDALLIRDTLNYRYETPRTGGQPDVVSLYHASELEVKPDGSPLHFKMYRESPGTKRTVSMTFDGLKVDSIESTVGFDVKQETPLPPHALVVVDQLISAWSVVLQALPLEDQDTFTLSVFAADKLTPLLVTIKVLERTTLKFGDETVPVLVCSISPLPGKFYIHAATQEILRYEVPEKQLVVELVPPAHPNHH